jgi:hypothetical protein
MADQAVPWGVFVEAEPALAEYATSRLNGRVAYLATLRADGSPRVHPLTPIIGGGHLFVFMEPTSPKGHDLQRDGRYALHCGVEDNSGGGGEVVVRGMGQLVESPELRDLATTHASYTPEPRYVLYTLSVTEVATTRYTPDGIVRRRWQSGSGSG